MFWNNGTGAQKKRTKRSRNETQWRGHRRGLTSLLTMLILTVSFSSAKKPAFATQCYTPVPDRIVERVEREEAQNIPITVRNDVRLTISKTMLLLDPNNEGIDQHNLLVIDGFKRREACTEPECSQGETYDAWYVTTRTAFWDSSCAKKWRDSGKPEVWQCQWVPDESSQKNYIAVKRWPNVTMTYQRVLDDGDVPGLFGRQVQSIARVTCSS